MLKATAFSGGLFTFNATCDQLLSPPPLPMELYPNMLRNAPNFITRMAKIAFFYVFCINIGVIKKNRSTGF